MMEIRQTPLSGVCLCRPRVYTDTRGSFREAFNLKVWQDRMGVTHDWVQDNYVESYRHVLRGLHFQQRHAQAKLIQVLSGVIYDVVVDLRIDSPTFSQYFACELDAKEGWQLYVPPQFAHGYYVRSQNAQVLYKTSDYYCPEAERSIIWNDPSLNIDWQIDDQTVPILSAKDRQALSWLEVLPMITAS